MNNLKLHSQSGKSLIEMVIVLTVAAILVTFAVAQFGSSKRNFTRQNIARELKVSLERARFDSVKRRPSLESSMASVSIVGETSFNLTVDLNQNGTLEPIETKLVSFPNSEVKIVGRNLVFPVTIKFNRFGQIIATNGIGTVIDMPYFWVCETCASSATATATNSNIITISPTGTVAMMNGGETQTTVQNPSVSSVSQDSDINPLVTVADSPGVVGVPTPTITPVSTPTPTPTPAPNTTPTPRVCARNERPTQDNCRCQSPMSVRSSGKCQ
jgi:prepilin-type N-terminal cleavage/methylation domain-containing protein